MATLMGEGLGGSYTYNSFILVHSPTPPQSAKFSIQSTAKRHFSPQAKKFIFFFFFFSVKREHYLSTEEYFDAVVKRLNEIKQ